MEAPQREQPKDAVRMAESVAMTRQDAAQLARRGVQSLLDSIQRAAPPVHDFIPHALLEQESVCPPAR